MHGTIDSAQSINEKAAQERAWSMPLAEIDVGNPELFRTDSFWPYFDRLRKEDPVHYCKDSMFGPYWSVTKYNDIMDIDTNHAVFSSASMLGGITIRDIDPDLRRDWDDADGHARAMRVLVDQVASLTDVRALNLHRRWCRPATT